ncbi:MAG: DUF4350 domain-containing protein [Ruminococcaceae bacterium]|nr:DUF4350 domain-containing protein [Oscillospiraceae bacterium]
MSREKQFDFKGFNTGALFLVRTPEYFPEGFAKKSFEDMKYNLHFDFAAWLETWNCFDGVLWKSDKFPRSSYWEGEERDPIEECFAAADEVGMTFIAEAGVMDEKYMQAHKDGMLTDENGNVRRYGRIGLSPSCPATLEYFKAKYDALLGRFSHHESCRAVCMPCENGVVISYDKYTKAAYEKEFGEPLPPVSVIAADGELENKVFRFLEEEFLRMYRALARHIKKKYGLPLMHYPVDKISEDSFFQPSYVHPNRNIEVMNRVEELDMLNMQLHPPLYPNPYFFKLETEYLMANANGIPCMADTHFYHEMAAGRLPDTTPKRIIDSILSTVTTNGISFFCYGFMAEQLPLWKKELNRGAPVYLAYSEEHTLAARREAVLRGMGFIDQLRGMLAGAKHKADLAIYYPEKLNSDYMYSSYATEHMFGLYELFNAAAIPVSITANIPESPEEQKAIIINNVRRISDKELKRLEKYLSRGGRLILIGKCSDEIERVAGVSTKPSGAKCVVSETSDNYNGTLFHLPLDGKHYYEERGESILCYNDGKNAVTRQGNVIYLGLSDEIGRFSLYRDFALASWVKTFFTEEKLNTSVEFHNVYVGMQDRHQFTSCDVYEEEGKKLLLLRNFGVEQNRSSVSWNIPENMRVTRAIVDGNAFEFKSGEALPMFEHFVAIFAEE